MIIKDDDFKKKLEDMSLKIEVFQDKMNVLFSKVKEDTNNINETESPISESSEGIEEEEQTEPLDKPKKHIIFEFVPEDVCMAIIKHLEENYKGGSVKEMANVFNMDKEEMTDNLEVLLNYGLIFERTLRNEKSYFINEGGYVRFIQEIKRL